MKVLLPAVLFLLAGCSSEFDSPSLNIEESVSWNDSYMQAAFEKKLVESGINYRKVSDNYFYKVRDRQLVREISKDLIREFSPDGAFYFYREEDWDKAKSRLDVESIPYRSIIKDDGYGVAWDNSYTTKVHQIIHDITRLPLEQLEHDHEDNICSGHMGSFKPVCSVISIKEHEVKQAKSDFDELGIYYEVLKSGGDIKIQWKIDDNEKVMKILKNANYYYDPKK